MSQIDDVDRYLRAVLKTIPSSVAGRASFVADLRSHMEEAILTGEPPAAVIARMGKPAEVASEFIAGNRLRYASFWRRLAAFAIDIAVILAVDLPLFALFALVSYLVNPAAAFRRAADGSLDPLAALLVLSAVSLALLLGGFTALYFPIAEGRFGQTIGKRLLYLRVVTQEGMAIGYKEAFLRRLPFYFRFGLIDALFIFFTEKRQRAFDIVAHTVVIAEPRATA